MAAGLHADEPRKGTSIPYIAHLMAVSALVLEDGGSEDEAIAALLHDTAEDHGGEVVLAQIRERFGDRVAPIVAACSDSLLPEGEEKEDWPVRKRRYLDALAAKEDEGALRVSNADKLHNARAILRDDEAHGEELWERFNTKSGPDQLWYYRSLADIYLEERGGSFLAVELDRVVRELESTLAE